MNTVKTPHMWTSNQNEVGLQRTCKLVDEWSVKFNAETRQQTDEDIVAAGPAHHPLIEGQYTAEIMTVERRYRVATKTQQAVDEAQLIFNYVQRINANGKFIEKMAVKLASLGYSAEAIAEVR